MRRAALALAALALVACGGSTGPSAPQSLVGEWISRHDCPKVDMTIHAATTTSISGVFAETCRGAFVQSGDVDGEVSAASFPDTIVLTYIALDNTIPYYFHAEMSGATLVGPFGGSTGLRTVYTFDYTGPPRYRRTR